MKSFRTFVLSFPLIALSMPYPDALSHTMYRHSTVSLLCHLQARLSAEAHISAITAHVAAKQKLVERCDAAADSLQEEAERTQAESNLIQRWAAGKQSEADIAQEQADSAVKRAAELTTHLEAAQQTAEKAKQLATLKQREAAVSQKESFNAWVQTDDARKKAMGAQERAALAQRALDQLSASLRPLKRSLASSGMDSEGSSGGASSSKRRRTSEPVQRVVMVQGDDLASVLDKMRQDSLSSINHTIYDFQGMVMRYTNWANPTILSSSITWRNGSILLLNHQSLVVEGRNVRFESLTVSGAQNGVWISSDGSLDMIGCRIRDVGTGIRMDGSSSFTARNLKMLHCGVRIFYLSGTSSATVSNAEVSGGNIVAIATRDSSNFFGSRMRITCTGRYLIIASGQSRLSFAASVLAPASTGLMAVTDQCALRLSKCSSFGNDFIKSDTATVQIER